MKQTKHFGLIGKNIAYSRSPQLHSELFAEAGRHDCRYSLIDLPDTAALLRFMTAKAEHFIYTGLNVTIPYKVEIIPFLSELDEKARDIGSVNTVAFQVKNGALYSKGYNTDYTGFVQSLAHYQIDVSGKHAVILGTGGVSRAIAAALTDRGADRITYVSTSPASDRMSGILSYEAFKQTAASYAIIVNCTPKGLYDLGLFEPMQKGVLTASLLYDLMYVPEKTQFVEAAEALGIRAVNGSFMLQAQAKAAQAIWFG